MGLPHNHEDDIKLRILLLLDIHRAACITLLLHFSFKTALIQARLRRLTSLEMRLQIIEVEHDCTLLNDGYSNDLHSLEIVLAIWAITHLPPSKMLSVPSVVKND